MDEAKRRYWPNHIKLGPVRIRVGSHRLAPWGFPRVQVGGLSLWSWNNTGGLNIASYHPAWSITWLWYVCITKRDRGYGPVFSAESRRHMAEQYEAGNPYADRPRWFHRFWQPAAVKRSQWHHYARLPFGFALVIGRQEAMPRKPTP
mgnify:FL=1